MENKTNDNGTKKEDLASKTQDENTATAVSEQVDENVESNTTKNEQSIQDSNNAQTSLPNEIEQEPPSLPTENKPVKRGDSFKEVKNFKRILIRATVLGVIKSFLLGLAFALPVYGLLMLLKRFSVLNSESKLSYVISIGIFLVVSAITFLALRQTNRTVAIKLDKEHKLSEKVQTMYAFRNQSGPMVDLQRQDANEAIATVKNKIIGIKRLWIYILCFVLGVGLCLVSFLFNPIPEENDGQDTIPEIPFTATEFQLAALSDLIDYVSGSEMQDPYKANIVLALTTLYTDIQEAETITQRDAVIQTAMNEINIQTDQSSSAVELMNALWSTNARAPRLLAKALNYYEWPKSSEWDRFTEQIQDLREGFIHDQATTEGADEQQIIEDTKNVFLTLNASILASLQGSGISSEDALYIVLTRLASATEVNPDGTRIFGMSALAEYIVQNGYAKAQRELDGTITGLRGEIYRSLSIHKTNTDTGEYAMKTLASIFGVQAPEFKRPELYDSSSGSTGDGDGGGADGGISGGPSYGSDDKVYDPFTNRYVEYGVILDKYYSIMFSKLNGESYTDEEKKALEEYFKILYGGFDNTNENE